MLTIAGGIVLGFIALALLPLMVIALGYLILSLLVFAAFTFLYHSVSLFSALVITGVFILLIKSLGNKVGV